MKKGMIRSFVLFVSLIVVAAGIPMTVYGSATITSLGQKVVLEGDRYRLTVDVDHKAAITSFVVDGTEWLQDGGNIHTGVKVNGVWKDSLALSESPVVTVSGQEVTIGFQTEYTKESWHIAAEKERANISFARIFKGNVGIEEQGFPLMSFGQDVVENIRWNKSGGNFWVGGKASAMHSFLAGGSGYMAGIDRNANIRRSMEDTTFTLLTGSNPGTALKVKGSTNRDSLPVGAAIEVDRTAGAGDKKLLSMAYVLSGPDDSLHYASGTDGSFMEGWPDTEQKQGHVRPTGNPIYKPVAVVAGQTDTAELQFEPDQYDHYYDLGTLNGVNERLLSEALNNYGRMMVLDSKYGTTQESPNVFFEVPAIQQHWNVAMGAIMQDDGVMETLKNGLRNIKNGVQAADGHIASPYVWNRSDSWGSKYGDMGLGYVLAISNVFNDTNDPAWAEEMKQSARKALEYEQNAYLDNNAKLLKNLDPFNPLLREPHNDYWEKSVGAYNAYTTVMYYEALIKWAAVERAAFRDTAQAQAYESLAVGLKESLNKATDQGGMWDDKVGALLYGTDNTPASVYLPPNAAALRAGLLPDERARRVVDTIERDNANFNLGFHVMNVRDLRDDSVPAPQDDNVINTMLGENGGWYGAPDGDYYAGYPIYGDRNKIPYFLNRFASYFDQTGFVNATTWKRDGVTPQDYGWAQSMPHTVMPIWGLYTYAYGFQPEAGRLVLAPFISESMIGSEVRYRWAKENMSVKYDSLNAYTVNIDRLPGDIIVRFINETPSASYQVKIDNHITTMLADSKGNVDVALNAAGMHRFELMNPDAKSTAVTGNAALGKPVTASTTKDVDAQTVHWPEKITDGDLKHGAWFAADNQFPAWVMTDLGRKAAPAQIKLYFGKTDQYSLKVQASNDRENGPWTEIATADNTLAGPLNPLTLNAGSGSYQYWKVLFTGTASGAKANLRELEIGDVTPGLPDGAVEEPEYRNTAGENYARQATVEVSSVIDSNPNSNWHYNKVNDGNRGADEKSAGWSSVGGPEQNREEWVKLDLGGQKEVGEVTLYPRSDPYDPGNGFPLDYQVLLSANGTDWSTVANVTYQPLTTDPVSFRFDPVSIRYVKVLATKLRDKNNANYYCQISEIEVLPQIDPETIRNVALKKPVQVSTDLSWTTNWLGRTAVDGLRTTDGNSAGWSSFSGPENRQEWLRVDLQGEHEIQEFRLFPRADSEYGLFFPVDYKIQVSMDGNEWTDSVSVTGAAKPYKEVKHKLGSAVRARYVRLLVTRFRGDSPDYLVQLAEFEVIGKGPIAVDSTPPVTKDDAPADWVNRDVTIHLTANDIGSGIAATYYTVDGGAQQTGSSVAFAADGEHTVVYWSVDHAGNVESPHNVTVKVDKTKPTLDVVLDQTQLWPPNHKMVTINATIQATDAGSDIRSVELVSITSNEPDTAGEDDQPGDIDGAEYGTSDTVYALRAERWGAGTGRVYTITYKATDKAGNETTREATVSVPHDKSGK